MSERRDRDERVSLHGLDPEEALKALLAVRPDDEPADSRTDQPRDVRPDDKRPAQSSD
jgi:hypothetical protein